MYTSQSDSAAEYLVCQGAWVPVRRRRRHTREAGRVTPIIVGFRAEAFHGGSDIHVMLALRCSFHQVVVADEQLDGTDMMGELFGEGQCLAHQA